MSAPTALSHHARVRLQQRAIPALMLPLIASYGKERYQRGGTTVWHLPHKSAQRLRRELKDILTRLDALTDMYFVEGDSGTIVTAGHAYKK